MPSTTHFQYSLGHEKPVRPYCRLKKHYEGFSLSNLHEKARRLLCSPHGYCKSPLRLDFYKTSQRLTLVAHEREGSLSYQITLV